MSLASLANQTATVERLTTTTDSWGGPVRAWSAVTTAKCRVQPVTGVDSIVQARPDLRISHRVYFPGSPDVQAGDRLKVDGLTLYVEVVRDIDRLRRLLTVDCEERDAA